MEDPRSRFHDGIHMGMLTQVVVSYKQGEWQGVQSHCHSKDPYQNCPPGNA